VTIRDLPGTNLRRNPAGMRLLGPTRVGAGGPAARLRIVARPRPIGTVVAQNHCGAADALPAANELIGRRDGLFGDYCYTQPSALEGPPEGRGKAMKPRKRGIPMTLCR
jgi:hypothetical protein